ncbi:hypothetical protein G3I60_27880 [Streptomyces sp. SID13666]|uniref:hypothetical protein n=1 Tax=Streptomyces TaxID=1883 RepID=UPI001106726E|nr:MULTISPECIES: hypothetical protein [Streptomyces]MCZ4096424.1 hypothetical protein [Streptomyces sp. H39-C1]NEA57875.1 hypothetical protein [Streptomyces sp. SID13666]NEA74937.1 hypothetical protein [Streptomyces sp. SID13588]QNA75488.1 hypothetical protein C8250_029595 [Streptomyces sp. So13.3]
MSAACPDIPIVVLPENNVVRGRTSPAAPVGTALTTATDALMRLHGELLNPAGAGDAVRKAMDAAVEETDRLAVEAMVVPMDAAALKPIVPNHEYFGVRTAPVDDARLVSEVTTIIARTLRDLRDARLDLNDQAYEVHAMAKILEGLAPRDAAAPSGGTPTGGRSPYVPGNDELTRWVITHHFYFVLNLAAAEAVSRAAAGLVDGDRDAAFDALQEAIAYVRGFTAAMIHSGDMSAPCYDAKVRPTMQPPAVPVALTGRTQPEHKAFRKAMRNLVKVSAQPFAELAATDPELALARDALLEADLQDIERHISVTAGLVGDDRSIVQGEASAESAVGVLRTMRHSRAELYRDLMRFGDPVTLIGA